MSPSTTRGMCKRGFFFFRHMFLLSDTRGKQPYVRRLADDHDALRLYIDAIIFPLQSSLGVWSVSGLFLWWIYSSFVLFCFFFFFSRYALLLVDCFAYCIFFSYPKALDHSQLRLQSRHNIASTPNCWNCHMVCVATSELLVLLFLRVFS